MEVADLTLKGNVLQNLTYSQLCVLVQVPYNSKLQDMTGTDTGSGYMSTTLPTNYKHRSED